MSHFRLHPASKIPVHTKKPAFESTVTIPLVVSRTLVLASAAHSMPTLVAVAFLTSSERISAFHHFDFSRTAPMLPSMGFTLHLRFRLLFSIADIADIPTHSPTVPSPALISLPPGKADERCRGATQQDREAIRDRVLPKQGGELAQQSGDGPGRGSADRECLRECVEGDQAVCGLKFEFRLVAAAKILMHVTVQW